MFEPEKFWQGLEALAQSRNLSVSALAKGAGLDATAFNISKRVSPDGRIRLPSLDTIFKIIDSLGITFADFAAQVEGRPSGGSIPYMGEKEFNLEGFTTLGEVKPNCQWDRLAFPGISTDDVLYTVGIESNEHEPIFREGSRIVVSCREEPRIGDRVLVYSNEEKKLVFGKLKSLTDHQVQVESYSRSTNKLVTYKRKDVRLLHRIMWASQ